MFAVGDIIRFTSVEANKVKYHLCISFDGHYLFLNSPKLMTYPGDFVVPCAEIPCVPATPSGQTIISCTLVMKKSDAELARASAKKLGSVSIALLRKLVQFVKASPVLTEEEKDAFYDAIGDWA